MKPKQTPNPENPPIREAFNKELGKAFEQLYEKYYSSDVCDGTDNAHPAWWRGHEAGVMGMIQRINSILDGKDDGSGVSSCVEYTRLRQRLITLVNSKDKHA